MQTLELPDKWENFTFPYIDNGKDKGTAILWPKDYPIGPLIFALRKIGTKTIECCAGHYRSRVTPVKKFANVSYPWVTYRIVRDNMDEVNHRETLLNAIEDGGFLWKDYLAYSNNDYSFRDEIIMTAKKEFENNPKILKKAKDSGYESIDEYLDACIAKFIPKPEPEPEEDTYCICSVLRGRKSLDYPNIEHNSLNINIQRERVLAYQLESVHLARHLLSFFGFAEPKAIEMMKDFELQMIEFYRGNGKLVNEGVQI